MNREIIFKSVSRLFSLKGLSYTLAMSLMINGAGAAMAAPAKAPAKTKTEKSGADNKSDDKKDSDKKDAKDDKKDSKDEKASDKKDAEKKDTKEAAKPEVPIENVVNVQAQDLVDKPHEYLGKNVKFQAPFVAFSNLALDYKPAFRSSKTHISLLVSQPKKKIPLSELKLAMMTPKDEKGPETQLLAALKEGDVLEITGKVFSAALEDPWVEILRLKKIGGAPDDKKADASKNKKDDTKASESKNDKGSAGKDSDSKPAK